MATVAHAEIRARKYIGWLLGTPLLKLLGVFVPVKLAPSSAVHCSE
jgi:bacteriorhodopsin